MMHICMAVIPYIGLAVLAGFLAVYFLYPVILVQFYLRFSVLYSGMRLRFVEIDGLSLCYGEKGRRRKEQPSMVLIHGFTADKFMWVPLVRKMPSDIHVIAVDLPGHGDSDTPTHGEEFSLARTVQTMNKLLQKMDFTEPFHLVGMSLGGSIAGLFAAEFPTAIHSLTMICPAMKTPVESQFWQTMCEAIHLDEELHVSCDLLFPRTADQVKGMLKVVQYNNWWIPAQILHGVATLRKRYYPFHFRLFKFIADPEMFDLLKSRVHSITAPTQVVWGEEDQVMNVSGAEELKGLLPNCQRLDIIPRCGHSMSTDRPGATTKAIMTFRQQLV